MTNRLALAFEITADPTRVKAGLAETRKELLATYADAKSSVAKLNDELTVSRTRAADMAKSMGTMGPPTRAVAVEFEKVKASVNAAQAAVEKKTVALQQTRQAARDIASAIAVAAQAERDWAAATQSRATAALAAGRNAARSASLDVLGVRSGAAIRAEMAEVSRAAASLKAGGAAAQDLARASEAAKARLAALNAELQGTAAAGGAGQASMAGAAHRMAAMAAAALAAREAIQLLRSSVDVGVQFDSLKTTYAFGNGGDVKKAADEMAYASTLSNRLGLELLTTTKAYGKLQAASQGTVLEGKATRDIFTAIASASAVHGLAAEEQAGALLAVSQMMSKGTISAEELRGQLGERLPGAFKIAAAAMKVTEEELGKMLELGQLTATQFLPKFAEALQASVNGALPAAERSARAQLQRLENAFTEFKLRIANSGLLDKVAEQLERLLDHVGKMADSGELDRLAKGFADAFGAAIKFMADAAIFAERFAGVLVPLASGLTAVLVGGRALALLGVAAPALAAAGTAASGAAVEVTALSVALRMIPALAIGSVLLGGVSALVEWGAKASEARTAAQALDANLRKLIASNEAHADAVQLEADRLAGFGDAAFAEYQKAIEGARAYAAASVAFLKRDNKDGKNDSEIAAYKEREASYNAYIDTVLAGEKARRGAAQLSGQLIAKEAEREKLLAGEVKQTRAEAIAEQIKGYDKLVEAIRKAREEAQKEAEEAKNKATDFREKATEKKQSASDKATQIREKDLTPEDKQANDLSRAQDAQSQGAYAAARAGVAQLEGRGKDFEKYTKEAEKFLERAMKFAESAQDANLVEDIGKQQAGLDNGKAKAEDKKAADAEAQAAALMNRLNEAQGKLTELKGEAATIPINADISSLVTKLAEAEAKMAVLKDKTITLTVNTVTGNSTAPADTSNMTRQELIDAIPGRAYGGALPGTAPNDRADNMLYWGTPGEHVMQIPAVRYYGRAFMDAVNSMRLPKYAFGGSLGGSAVNRLSIPNVSSSASSDSSRPMYGNFILNDQSYQVSAQRATFDDLTKHFQLEALKKGRRK